MQNNHFSSSLHLLEIFCFGQWRDGSVALRQRPGLKLKPKIVGVLKSTRWEEFRSSCLQTSDFSEVACSLILLSRLRLV